MGLEVFGDGLDALSDAVSDDEEQEATPPEVGRQGVVELDLVHAGMILADEIEEGVALTLQAPADLALEVRGRPAAQLLGVVEDLTDDLAPTSGFRQSLHSTITGSPVGVTSRLSMGPAGVLSSRQIGTAPVKSGSISWMGRELG